MAASNLIPVYDGKNYTKFRPVTFDDQNYCHQHFALVVWVLATSWVRAQNLSAIFA